MTILEFFERRKCIKKEKEELLFMLQSIRIENVIKDIQNIRQIINKSKGPINQL